MKVKNARTPKFESEIFFFENQRYKIVSQKIFEKKKFFAKKLHISKKTILDGFCKQLKMWS
jgi:hypothetical protein